LGSGILEDCEAIFVDNYSGGSTFTDHFCALQMEDVLYIKFKQHPSLRTLLLHTGLADIVYADGNDSYWGHGPLGEGANELGKALMRVRDKLRAEGER
jgi:predicted NAD-dependent protein-ADP-ribosyltransferase YbiA (DUF1768 family)